MNVFLLHFCAHVCASYFLCHQAHTFLRKANLHPFLTLILSIAIALLIGYGYKFIEMQQLGHYENLLQAMVYNITGALLAAQAVLINGENQRPQK